MHKNAGQHKTKTAIVGIRGYSGLELARLLLKHPNAELVAGFATDANFSLTDYLDEASAAAIPMHAVKELESQAGSFDTVFLATPAEVSAELAPKLLDAGCQVIDLSGAFRLKGKDAAATKKLYKDWYGFEHPVPELVAQAFYGLVPWCGPARPTTKLVSNPGCYATAVLMAVLPLLKEKVIDPASLVIDAKSGTTGAGRKAAENLLYTEVEGECLPYRIGRHQHLPEICAHVDNFTHNVIDPMFTTHLLATRRGITAGIYARLAKGQSAEAVTRAFEKAYAGYPLVKQSRQPSLKRVVGTARTHLHTAVEGDKVYVFSLIDNLLKGAASQAIENLNLTLDLAPETALTQLEGVL